MLEELRAVLERVKSTSGSNDKISILEEFKDNDNVRNGLYFLFNDFIVTGLSDKKISKELGVLPNVNINTLPDAIDYLMAHKTGTDIDIANIQNYISQNEDSRQFLEQYLTKSFKCGITAKSVNKAFGESFIPEFACQLAHPYAKYSDRVQGIFTLTTKLDGHRTIVAVDSLGNSSFFTRKGKAIEGLNQIADDIKTFANKSGILGNVKYTNGFVLDGEGIILDDSVPKNKVFQETGKIIRKNGTKTGLAFKVFDLIPIDEFYSGESTLKYLNRRADMDTFFDKEDYEHLSLVPALYIGDDTNIISTIMLDQTGAGEEGIMINLDETYKTKRHPGILKVKEFFTDDLLVTDIYEGGKGTKYANTLGGVYVDYKGSKVGVGSGFSDEERDLFFNDPESIIGRIVEVQYFEETTNSKNEEVSLRFPVYKGIREDKSEDDVNVES